MKPLVLIVEDEAPLVTLLRYNLEKEGFAVCSAGDGEEALLQIAENKPDAARAEFVAPVRVKAVEIGFQQPRAFFIGGAAFAQQREQIGDAHLLDPHPGEAAGEHGAGHRAGLMVEVHAQIGRRHVGTGAAAARAAKPAPPRAHAAETRKEQRQRQPDKGETFGQQQV